MASALPIGIFKAAAHRAPSAMLTPRSRAVVASNDALPNGCQQRGGAALAAVASARASRRVREKEAEAAFYAELENIGGWIATRSPEVPPHSLGTHSSSGARTEASVVMAGVTSTAFGVAFTLYPDPERAVAKGVEAAEGEGTHMVFGDVVQRRRQV
eukprot:CAMPEP_0117519758 /NCGR_PEP_ID=MMETSP0784-20121206/32817_1 /TAXON_ID=39447 /ORGANISM="" /LENGTH=156 /DNA_ID=CAMNT_0005315729 /DNA_START=14 /DNA_END=484 /DNA_ORIENTATION=-